MMCVTRILERYNRFLGSDMLLLREPIMGRVNKYAC
jgi:hypothetical protein